jgi:Ca2+-transporting ATPase
MADVALTGLSDPEAEKKLSQFGLNQVAKPAEIRFLDIVKEEVAEPMITLLLVVGFFYVLWGSIEDAVTILVVISLLVLVEVWNEYRAKKAISALSRIAAPISKVLRGGRVVALDTIKIVPGDVLILASGTRIAADAKVLLSYSLLVDESSLTGESFPVEKKAGDEIYAGTLVVAGEGKAEAASTGKNTRIGKIAALAKVIKPPKTPLQLSMKSLAKKLVYVAVFFSLIIPIIGVLRGQDLREMILTGLSLAFATIPEELPIIITMVLGLGAYKLSKQHLLIKKLKAAEALGNASVIVTDKTGTITENRMRIVSYYPEDKSREILSAAASALTGISSAPMDKAVLEAAEKVGKLPESKIIRERIFGDGRKTKSVLRESSTGFELFVSGAPEEVMNLLGKARATTGGELDAETAKGRRVIAVARKKIAAGDVGSPFSELERDLVFVGLISFEDPPRSGVKETIEKASRAGIRTIMVTGDHPKTAGSIAAQVGISVDSVLTGDKLVGITEEALQRTVKQTSVFARASPENKYLIVKALQKNGEVVAVTGDGVNDTLALKEADIGVAMGLRGTDAAKEAADIVVADDDFVTIGNGIFEGRKFFDNLRKGVRYYLSVKAALIMVFLLPILLGTSFLLAPIQIIILELFMDLAASSAFVAEPAEKTILSRPPRRAKDKFVDDSMLTGIFISGLSLFAAVAGSYFYASYQHLSPQQTQTYAFTAWIIGHLILAFISRSEKEPLYSLGLLSNKVMNIWAIIVAVFLALVLGVPQISAQLKLVAITPSELGIIAAIAFAAIFWQEIIKTIAYLLKKKP